VGTEDPDWASYASKKAREFEGQDSQDRSTHLLEPVDSTAPGREVRRGKKENLSLWAHTTRCMPTKTR
jgi:hypothetical protein